MQDFKRLQNLFHYYYYYCFVFHTVINDTNMIIVIEVNTSRVYLSLFTKQNKKKIYHFNTFF